MLNTGYLSELTTSVDWKGENGVSEMTISAARVKTKPKYGAESSELLARCRAFYEDEENEKAYQEWKAGKEAKR